MLMLAANVDQYELSTWHQMKMNMHNLFDSKLNEKDVLCKKFLAVNEN